MLERKQKCLQAMHGVWPTDETILATYYKKCHFPFTVWDISEE